MFIICNFILCNRACKAIAKAILPKLYCHAPEPIYYGQHHLPVTLAQYGPVFSFTMLGTEVTYLAGEEVTGDFWNSHNDDLAAEDLYANLTVPVFGKGVAYDVPHKVSLHVLALKSVLCVHAAL